MIHTTTLALTAALAITASAQAAIIDVNLTRSGAPTETGFVNWVTGDNTVPSPLAIGSLTLSVVDINAGTTLRSIDRGGDDGYAGTLPALTQTWWGQRASSTGAGGYITIDISGLAGGDYTFTSWHLDHQDQTGGMKVEISTNDGGSFADAVSEFDLVSGNESATAPVVKTFNFTSTGADIHIRFKNTNVDDPDGQNSSGAFALVNGFSIDSTAVPEPASLAMGLMGMTLIAARRRR